MSEQFAVIPVDMLTYSGRNPRTEMRGLEELAENIKEYGVLEPIIVRPREEKFEVVVGERRVRASIVAGLKEIPAVIRALTDSQTDELRLIENIHRDDLTDAEKGDAVLALLDYYPDKYPTIRSVCEKLGKPYKSVWEWTFKSRKLSEFVKESVVRNRLDESDARRLLKYGHSIQTELAEKIMEHQLSKREVVEFLKLYDEKPDGDLDELATKVKGVEVIEIPLHKLPEEIRKGVIQVVEEGRKERRIIHTEEEKEKISKAHKEMAERKKKARKKLKEQMEKEDELAILKRVEVPKEVIREKAEALIEKLNEIEHPLQRGRMAKEVPKALEGLVKRVERAPEKRELVERKLDRLRELEEEGVFLSTLWDIGERAEYAGTREFHGNCPPQVIEQCVLRLTRTGDLVVDPMAGSGTAIDVCNMLDRKYVAYDIKPPEWRKDIIQNDSRKIPLDDNSVDMVFLHPPYWDMVYYTIAEEKLPDLSRAKTLEEYSDMLKQVLQECHRILKNGKYLCILLGDRIKEGEFIPLCRKTANLAEEVGFTDCGYAVKFTKGATSLMVKGKMIYAELAYTENLKVEHDLVMFFKKGES